MSAEIITKEIEKIDLALLKKTNVNLVIFGHGLVGGALITQILKEKKDFLNRKSLKLNIVGVANSTTVLLKKDGVQENWKELKVAEGIPCSIEKIITFVKEHKLENLIAIDNTADATFVSNYETLVANGFHLVSSNKIANTQSLESYNSLRKALAENDKEYLYETNVGAGLPLIDTIKLLHLSGENITRIKGVFSGSLSYIFNTFSEEEKPFSEVLKEAISLGLTEPDPREDLCGKDVARKLLILARELELFNELEDVEVQNLIPKRFRTLEKDVFLRHIDGLDSQFELEKNKHGQNNVLRYVGELSGDLSKNDGAVLEVKLVSVSKNSVLGQLKGSDTIFEIYTENYSKNPLVIQGAGAGAEVTARGVFGDILRLVSKF